MGIIDKFTYLAAKTAAKRYTNEKISELPKPLVWKDSVATYNDLPSLSGVDEGWMYTVLDTGIEYACAKDGNTKGWREVGASSDKMNKLNPTGTGKFQINGASRGEKSIAIGDKATAYGDNSVAEGTSDHLASDFITDTEIDEAVTSANKNSRTNEDVQNIKGLLDIWDHQDANNDADQKFALAAGCFSKVEGANGLALAKGSHAEGNGTVAAGKGAHAEGISSQAIGHYSHAEGNETIASGQFQHVEGKYNIEDTAGKYVHVIGNGTGSNARSNAHTLDWNGNAWYAGDVIGNKDGVEHKLSAKQNTSNMVQFLSSDSTPDQYPSAKCVYDIVGNVESALTALRGGEAS